MKPSLQVACILLSTYAAIVHAQPAAPASAASAPPGFPADAVSMSDAEMQQTFSGKNYSTKFADGSSWSWQFKSNGYFFFNTSKGFSDSGKWSAKDGKLCTEGRKIDASCNEVRQQGSVLRFKRDNGEIVVMSVQ